MKEKLNIKRILSMTIAFAMILSMTACGKKDTNENDNGTPDISNNTDSSSTTQVESQVNPEKLTVMQLKAKYAADDGSISGDKYIRPFYNVEQTTRFTFHFNSVIEPYKAITVHTDPKCGVNSTVYQVNDGYLLKNGVDVVVKPGKPILNTSDRKSGELENYNWGNAPIYYICIHYDMDSSAVTELSEPIIIPFTIRNEISTPNLTYSIDSDGTFRLNWKQIDGAVKYNIYKANAVRDAASKYTRSECAYIGDHLELLTTVSGDTTTFTDFGLDGKDSCNEFNGYILQQNMSSLDTYYVTAEDAYGNESAFSMAVEGWKHSNQLPFTFDDNKAFQKNDEYIIENLPETVFVTMADGTTASFPVNYIKLSEDTDRDVARYKYQIQGTRLTGEILGDISYKVNDRFPDIIKSSYNVNTDLYTPENNIDIVPNNNVTVLSNDNKELDLGTYTVYDETNKFVYDHDEILARADLEAARIVRDGVYGSDPLDSFMTHYDFEYTPVDSENSIENDSSVTVQPNENQEEQEGQQDNTEQTDNNNEYESESESEGIENTDINSNEQSSEDISNTDEPEVITSDNLVQQQIEETQQDVEEADQVEIQTLGYKIFADSAEEEYLALQIINCEEEVSLKAFPKLQNCEYLIDALMKVHYQNPYNMGMNGIQYDPDTQILSIKYSDTKENMQAKQKEIAEQVEKISKSIIKDGMTQEEKIEAIWNYLEQNTKYDYAALEYAEQNNFNIGNEYIDSFTTYGILCKKVGVCQSYAYTVKLLCEANGVTCNVLTGFMNKTLPHGWNAVELDGKWYWIDATNNVNVTGIPYMLYQASTDFGLSVDYVLDKSYEIDTNLDYITYTDSLRDWYVEHGLMAGDPDTVGDIVIEQLDKGSEQIFVKLDSGTQVDEQFLSDVASKLMQSSHASDIQNYKIGYAMGFIGVLK